MGHLRTGRLPKTKRWRAVLALLDGSPDRTALLARQTALASEAHLRELGSDPALVECFWLLTRLTWAARGPDFAGAVSTLGLVADDSTPVPHFMSQVADAARTRVRDYPGSGHAGEISSLALRRTLSETVGQYTGNLFGSSVEELRQAFREHATERRFGALASRFFGDILARTLRSYVDRELANHIGDGHALATIDEASEVRRSIDVHARQSARIMEDFAAEWWSKHNWESKGEVGRDEAAGFVGHAMRKLRRELRIEAEAS